LADCLFPGATPPENLQQAARVFTSSYQNNLSNSAALKQRFSIVRLVPTIEIPFYQWWCMDLKEPRMGLRENTITIYGQVEQVGSKLELWLMAGRRGKKKPATDSVLLAIEGPERAVVLKRIGELVESIANGM
jgi:hypothetical protein